MNVELQEDFRFSTGARSGQVYMYPDFPAVSVEAHRAGRKFLVRSQEPAEKGKGVHILVEIPYAIIPSLMEAILKSLSDTRE